MIQARVRELQRRLQALYALDHDFDAAAFVVGSADRAVLAEALGGAPSNDREALWVVEAADELSVALCLADELRDGCPLDDATLDRYCALIEGVSHLTYLLDRAEGRRPLTLLEMELQAEVDKFVTTWLARVEAQVELSVPDLHRRLFVECRLPPRECPDETSRYREANRLAHRYCGYLQDRFLGPDRVEGLMRELRRFWRMGMAEKLGHISQAYRGTRSAA